MIQPTNRSSSDRDLADRVVLVTGATDGLGRATAEVLASRGATVLIHGRDPERGSETISEITERTGSNRLRWYQADFSDLNEVRDLARRILADEPRVNVLINNAGLGVEQTRHVSHQGNELTFQVDYLAPYMLSYLLAERLLTSGPSRIINVASAGQAPIDFADVMLTRRWDPVQAYCQAKLADVMLTFDLAEQLPPQAVTANCLHPASYMPTKIVTHMFTPQDRLEVGVSSLVHLTTSDSLATVTGQYFNRTSPARADAQAYDVAARSRLRALAEELTGVRPEIAQRSQL